MGKRENKSVSSSPSGSSRRQRLDRNNEKPSLLSSSSCSLSDSGEQTFRDKVKTRQGRSRSRSDENATKEGRRKEKRRKRRESCNSQNGGEEKDDKKEAEEIRRQQLMRKEVIERELKYRDDENPFGDSRIYETLNWGNSQKNKAKTLEEIQEDIQRIKVIREQRKDDEKRMEEERTKQQREREEDTYQQWKLKEESFHAYQARIRALVRITQGKETTVDKINKIFYIYRGKIRFSEHLDSIMSDIQGFLKRQDEDELEKILAQAINHHNQLNDPSAVSDQHYRDENEIKKFASFWESVKAITQFYLDALRRQQEHHDVQPEFESQVQMIFQGKILSDLISLEKEIFSSIQSATFGPQEEQEYWQNMLKRLQLFKGDAVLKNLYNYFVSHQKEHQTEEALEIEVENTIVLTEEQILADEIILEQEDADAHVYSPVLQPITDEAIRSSQTQTEFVEQLTDLRSLYFNKILKRAIHALDNKRVKESKFFVDTSANLSKSDRDDVDAATLRLLEQEKKKPMEEDEIIFDDQEQLNDKTYEWSDKHRSKKPRYFNRVKQGFDWNKYNQMHFDSDNPPPKYIQGYKFNVFYPELIDEQKTPEYFLETSDEQGFCVIRFSAGPPYEDVAFKIVNREWDYADKKGFKCYFNRGVLTLHFNFKRNRYRR